MTTRKRILCALALAASFALLGTPALAEQPEDAWITTKVKLALLTDDIVDGTDVNVDTFDGKVTLYGEVASAAEKERAATKTKEIEGVQSVENLITVGGTARADAKVDDAALRERVTEKLRADAALSNSNVEVESVSEGVVTLGGTAKSLSAERRAVHTARDVDGVRRVVNQIDAPDQLADDEVWGDGRSGDASLASDAWITTKAKLSLMADPGIAPTRVNVDTRDGVVTLFGSVGTEKDRLRAAEKVQQLDGVKRVMNELQVVPDVAADRVAESDDKLTEAVRARFAERESLSDADIDVAAENGVVRLTGTVENQRERVTALTVARNTRGVRAIVDGLELRAGTD
ncbi:MAG TPA: BON domain-containing protein [Myxococcota bacterium]|nr:BON domain-containing protein [Myxococcota bacterium]